MQHRCHVKDCEVVVPLVKLMCKTHWFMVPSKMRADVLDTYKPGQEAFTTADEMPSIEWIKAAREALNFVSKKEGTWGK